MLHVKFVGIRCTSLLLIVHFAFFASSCVYYDEREASPRYPPVHEKNIILVHRGEAVFHIQEPQLEDGRLVGYTFGQYPISRKTRGQELHIYVSSSYEYTVDETRRVSIPLDEISKVVLHDVNLKKTIITTSVLTSVLTTIGTFIGTLLILSCPLVYEYSGQEYVFAGEIYGGALQAPLERHDYLVLSLSLIHI